MDRRFVGIRVLIHDMPDRDWIVRPGPDAGLAVLAAEQVPFDYVTADPSALRHVPTICERHPDLRLVIDHLAKPPVGGSAAQLRSWRELLARAAESPLGLREDLRAVSGRAATRPRGPAMTCARSSTPRSRSSGRTGSCWAATGRFRSWRADIAAFGAS